MKYEDILKSKGNILYTSFPDGYRFTYRLLSMKEYNAFKAIMDGGLMSPFMMCEEVFRLCFYGNYDSLSENVPFGYINTIGELIIELSGDTDGESLLIDIAKSREKNPADSLLEYMRAVILTAFPSYSLEDIESWTKQEFIRRFTISENIMLKKDPQFKQLDLAAIYEQNFKKEEKKEEKGQKDLRKDHIAKMRGENERIKNAQGHWETQDAEMRFQQEQKHLSQKQLQELEKRKKQNA